MPKPLKSKHLNRHSRLRDQILSRQGVGEGKRKRLGHSSHFGKVEVIPIVRKEKKPRPASKDDGHRNKFSQKEGSSSNEAELDKVKEKSLSQEQEPSQGQKPRKESINARLPGESFIKFMKRLNTETQQMLITQAGKNSKVTEKRKNFLNQRKRERKDKILAKKKGLHKIKEDSEDDEDGPTLSEEKIRAAVHAAPKFGDQVERPPIIRMSKPLKGLFKAPPSDGKGGGYVVGGMPAIPEMSGDSIKKMQMEALRNNAISQLVSLPFHSPTHPFYLPLCRSFSDKDLGEYLSQVDVDLLVLTV